MAATLAALEAATLSADSCAVAPSIACVKWWTAPVGPLTADLRGEAGAGYVETVAAIADRLSQSASGPAVAGLALVDATRPDAAGLHVEDAGETGAAALDRLLLRASLAWSIGASGTLNIAPIAFGAPVETVTASLIEREAAYPPVVRFGVGYRRNHRQHSPAEISAAIAAADVSYGDGTSAEAARAADLAQVARIQSDGWLTAGEKPDIIRQWTDFTAEKTDILAKAASLGVSSATYDAAHAALATYLSGLSPAWNNTTLDTAIAPATFNGKFSDLYFARQLLLDAMTAKAATLSTWSGTADDDGLRPANGATRNADGINLISAPNDPTTWAFLNGASSTVLFGTQHGLPDGTYALMNGTTSIGYFGDYVDCRPGEKLWFSYFVGSNYPGGPNVETLNASVAFLPPSGPAFAVNLSDAPHSSKRTLAQCYGGITVVVPFTVPANATRVRPYIERPVFTAYSFFANRAQLLRSEPGATRNRWYVSASDPGGAEGDGWRDTSATPNRFRLKVGVTWIDVSSLVTDTAQITDGAQLGLTALWSGVAGAGKPSDNAGTTVDLVAQGANAAAYKISGNTVTRTSAGSGFATVVSLASHTGSAIVSGKLDTVGTALGMGVPGETSTDPQFAMRHRVHRSTNGLWYTGDHTVASNDFVQVAAPAGVTFDANTHWDIIVRGKNVLYKANGTVVRTSPSTAGLTLEARVVCENTGNRVSAVDFDPYGDVTEAQPIVSQLNPVTGRMNDARGLPPIIAMNLGYKFTGAISYTATAGSPATATISVAAGQMLTGSNPISYSAMSASVTGTGGTTQVYQLYVQEGADPAALGGSKPLTATITSNDIYASDNRVWLGAVTVIFPNVGSNTGAGAGGGGGGYYGNNNSNPIP